MERFLNLAPVRFITELLELYFGKRVPQAAAALAYYLILTFFPVLICVNAFVGRLNLDVNNILAATESVLPAESLGILGDYLIYITENQSSGLLAAGLSVAVVSASAAFRTLMNTMDALYDRKSYRGLWQLVASILCSVLLLVTIYLSIVVVLTGEWLFGLAVTYLRLPHAALPWDWQWMRFLLLFAMVFLLVLVVYRVSAPRGKPRPPVITGALLAAVALVGSSILFSWFIGLSSRYSLVYGSLASVIILLAWLSLCGNILMLGNVFNCVWYRHKKIHYLKRLKRDGR